MVGCACLLQALQILEMRDAVDVYGLDRWLVEMLKVREVDTDHYMIEVS
jgi:hypothetical protein